MMIASEKRKYWISAIIVAVLIFVVHAFVDPYFHIFQIGGIIVSGLTSFVLWTSHCFYSLQSKGLININE